MADYADAVTLFRDRFAQAESMEKTGGGIGLYVKADKIDLIDNEVPSIPCPVRHYK